MDNNPDMAEIIPECNNLVDLDNNLVDLERRRRGIDRNISIMEIIIEMLIMCRRKECRNRIYRYFSKRVLLLDRRI